MAARLHRHLSRTSTPGRLAFGIVLVVLCILVIPTVVRASARSPITPSSAPPVPVSPAGAVDGATRTPTKGAYLGPASAPKIALVGDSLLFAAGWWTTTYLDKAGYQVWLNGDVGKTVADRAPKLDEMLASKPDVVVIELGTNDVGQASREVTRARQDEALERVLANARAALDRAAAVPCVVWVTPSAHVNVAEVAVGGAEMHNRLAAKYTAAIDAEAQQRHPNVVVADWSAWSAGHPEWFEADGIHSNTIQAGQRGMADLITQSVQQCRRP